MGKHVCNFKVHPKAGGWECTICFKNFRVRRDLEQHRKIDHPNVGHLNQFSLAKLHGETLVVSQETKEKIANAERGDKNPAKRQDVREKISASMKKAHAEGRAHNIGECRWNNEPSYPEQWFMKVLKNEFGFEKDKDYKMEFPFHKFSLDFAWPNERICIEIDGEQHERFQEQKNRDIEKDRLLKEGGWIELRKSWKDIYNNPKSFIEEVRNLLK